MASMLADGTNSSADSLATFDLDWPTWRRWNRNWRFRFDVSIVSRSI
jgi:hypothetical protein